MSRIGECEVNSVHHNTCFHLSVLWYCCLSSCSAVENIHWRRKASTWWKTKTSFLLHPTMPVICQAGVFLQLPPTPPKGISEKLLSKLPHHSLQGARRKTAFWSMLRQSVVGVEDLFSEAFEWSRQKEHKEVPPHRLSPATVTHLNGSKRKYCNYNASSQKGIISCYITTTPLYFCWFGSSSLTDYQP